MQNQTCQNCGSKDPYSQEVNTVGTFGPNILPLGWIGWTLPKFEIRVCGSCGLTEWFVPERLLPKVRKKFLRKPAG